MDGAHRQCVPRHCHRPAEIVVETRVGGLHVRLLGPHAGAACEHVVSDSRSRVAEVCRWHQCSWVTKTALTGPGLLFRRAARVERVDGDVDRAKFSEQGVRIESCERAFPEEGREFEHAILGPKGHQTNQAPQVFLRIDGAGVRKRPERTMRRYFWRGRRCRKRAKLFGRGRRA